MNYLPFVYNRSSLSPIRIKWIILILAFPWFADFLLLFVNNDSKSFASFVTPTLDEIIFSCFLQSTFLLSVFLTATFCSRIHSRYGSLLSLVSNKSFSAACASLLPIFLILDSVFILSSLKNGLTNAILAFRFNTQPIGVLGYTTLLFFPIVLSVAWARNKSIVNYFLLILITFTNLLTGFRILLINAFFLLVIYNYRHFHSIKTKNKVIGLLLFLALLLFFESLRGALESNNSEALFGFGSLLQSVGRSLPIRYIAVALREHVIFDWTFSLNVFTEPFSLILSTIFSLDKPEPISIIVANPVVRAFLVWRGTSDAISSGFSINILANAFILDGFLGLLGFSIILGIFLGIGLRLLQAQSMINRLVGTCFITFVIGSSESFGEAWKLLVYWTVFLFGLVFYSRLIQNLAFAKTLK